MESDVNNIWIVEESSYAVRGNDPYVLLFSRNYNDPFTTITHEFKYYPYFYVPYGSARKVSSTLIRDIDDTEVIDALGRSVQKVYTWIPVDVSKVKHLFEWRDESDVVFDKRFLIDKKIKYAYEIVDGEPVPVDITSPLDPRKLMCDIEVLAPLGIMPLPQNAIYPIIMIQCLDSYTGKIVVFTIDMPCIDDTVQFCCKDESDLIKTYCSYIKELNPDVLVFWNGGKFDIPYLINRAAMLGISVTGLSRHGRSRTQYENGVYSNRVPGRSILDMLDAFKKFTIGMGNRESYSLKNVIVDKDLLKDHAFEYVDYGPILSTVVNEKRYSDLIDYGKNDVIALKHIDDALGLYMFYESLKMVSGAKLDDMLYNSRIIEMLLWHEGIRVMPEKKVYTSEDEDDKFKGALVITPVPGVHEMMATYDLASLYPMILCAFQLSPDIDKIVLRTLEKTMALREELRAKCKADPDNEVLQNMQNAIKFLNNSYYGVLGLKAFRLYDRTIAETVTRTGRELNMFLQEVAQSQGYNVIFGDTDSIGVISVNGVTTGKELEKTLNDNLKKWSEEHDCKATFNLKFEKLYRRILFKADKKGVGVKKKYCGHIIWEEGRDKSDARELNYKGLELKRSDQSNITRECLHYFLETLLLDDNDKDAANFVKTKYKEVIAGSTPIYEISIPKALRKVKYDSVNPWVNGIQNAQTLYNYNIAEGAKPRLIYLKYDQVICIDDDFDTTLIQHDIDWNKMADVTIRKKMESYIWSIGMTWEGVVDGQRDLSAWF